ncbi:hypothetical protein L1987_13175 [Smallanthus sonchifolius]|uniref:Uncharacterized protein n=1 Tax=Smallanthus sonchifolius TaxID=185202 RepID=A0ACB9JGT0_9ASTR|nr:hypothetical protein L1987_13175 [Smallanthus sonchifolius]
MDAEINSPHSFDDFCSNLGLESVTTYPFILLRRGNWDKDVYASRPYTKHFIVGLNYIKDEGEIKKAIIKNFGSEGDKFPILCAFYMGKFIERDVALEIANSGKPYHSSPDGSSRDGYTAPTLEMEGNGRSGAQSHEVDR